MQSEISVATNVSPAGAWVGGGDELLDVHYVCTVLRLVGAEQKRMKTRVIWRRAQEKNLWADHL